MPATSDRIEWAEQALDAHTANTRNGEAFLNLPQEDQHDAVSDLIADLLTYALVQQGRIPDDVCLTATTHLEGELGARETEDDADEYIGHFETAVREHIFHGGKYAVAAAHNADIEIKSPEDYEKLTTNAYVALEVQEVMARNHFNWESIRAGGRVQ